MGQPRYPDATLLMITADAGGSKSERSRASTVEPGKPAAAISHVITECHIPPETSKWSKIEHWLTHAELRTVPTKHHDWQPDWSCSILPPYCAAGPNQPLIYIFDRDGGSRRKNGRPTCASNRTNLSMRTPSTSSLTRWIISVTTSTSSIRNNK